MESRQFGSRRLIITVSVFMVIYKKAESLIKNNLIALSAIFLVYCGIGFAQNFNQVANPKVEIKTGEVRFMVLKPVVIRMEWLAGSSFENYARVLFANMNLPVPKYKTSIDNEWPTSILRLRYKKVQFDRLLAFMKFLTNNNWDKSKYTNDNVVYSA